MDAFMLDSDSSEPFHLETSRRALVVIDVVESVRRMTDAERDFISLWLDFVQFVQTQVLPAHGGRLVKSLGDGLLLEFIDGHEAVVSAFELHDHMAKASRSSRAGEVRLRAGVHTAQVVIDKLDIFGTGVNLAARLAALAPARGTVVSAEIRDLLTDGLDARIEDLGECFVKHIDEPVRAYRVSQLGDDSLVRAATIEVDLRPSIAILPLAGIGESSSNRRFLGEAIADDVASALRMGRDLRIISRLSSAPFAGHAHSMSDLRRLLHVAYVVSGSVCSDGATVIVRVELSETKSGEVLWNARMSGLVTDVFEGKDDIVPAIAAEIGREIRVAEVARTTKLPLPNLESYSLFVGGVSLLHRFTLQDFQRSYDVLSYLSDRNPHCPLPKAMLARWHTLRLIQGWSRDPQNEGQRARDWAERALDVDSNCGLALATKSLLLAQFGANLDQARRLCESAIAVDPQLPQAWTTYAGIQCYLGDGIAAEQAATRAICLSPLDPDRFMFDLLLGAAKLTRNEFDQAIELANASLRLNSMHAPVHRLLVISLALAGRAAEATAAGKRMLAIEPGFRVSDYEKRYPGRGQPHAARFARALRSAGLPA